MKSLRLRHDCEKHQESLSGPRRVLCSLEIKNLNNYTLLAWGFAPTARICVIISVQLVMFVIQLIRDEAGLSENKNI